MDVYVLDLQQLQELGDFLRVIANALQLNLPVGKNQLAPETPDHALGRPVHQLVGRGVLPFVGQLLDGVLDCHLLVLSDVLLGQGCELLAELLDLHVGYAVFGLLLKLHQI